MSELFYNPYQFIAVDTRKAKSLIAYQQQDGLKHNVNKNNQGLEANAFVRHDYWHKEGVSGRIRCTLETLSPLVIGAAQIPQENNEPAEVVPYRDPSGNPAVPGSSLRGLISSTVETISQSSLRVLVQAEKGEYSVRKPAKADAKHAVLPVTDAPLKNIGLLVSSGDGRWEIFPLVDESRQKKALRVGDYLNKGDKPEHAERWRQESKVLRQLRCYQGKHNNALHAYAGKSGVYHIRGENRVLGKRRETFIPWDGRFDQSTYNKQCLRVGEDVVAQLETILRTVAATQKDVKQREEIQQQMLPMGYAEHVDRVWQPDPNKTDPQPLVLEGDLLYYRAEGTGENEQVVELSYSSIWRKAVPGSLQQAFINSADKNAIPWNPDRDELTPAEALFGVTEDKSDDERRGGARNLASRLRFSDAVAADRIILDEAIPLRILNSPKPPSPSMYFGAKQGYIEKTRLNLNLHSPNGRKFYLPHPDSLRENPKQHWRSNNTVRQHMKVSCQPIAARQSLTFEIYFENLSQAELGLLLTALQPGKPEKKFVHRLGLGKPLGLGHIELATKVEVIERASRYSVAGLLAKTPRYQPWQGVIDQQLVDKDTLARLREIADPELIRHDVCYPFSERDGQSSYGEDRGFQWFSRNDSSNQQTDHQALAKVVGGKPPPALKS